MLKPIVLTLCGFLFGAAAAGQVAGQTPRASEQGERHMP
jgi:hypothetical protein